MARNVDSVNVVGSQSFDVSVVGLNIYSKLEVYYEGKKVPDSQLEPRGGALASKGYTIQTDDNGSANFIFYLQDLVQDYAGKSEASFLNYLDKDAGLKTLVVIDEASYNGDTLPNDYKTRVKCYAEVSIQKTYEITFNETKDWGPANGRSRTAEGKSYTNTYGS